MDEDDRRFETRGPVWQWQSATKPGAAWHFLSIEGQVVAEIRYATMGMTGGFGSIKVAAMIGTTRWRTSIFPHRDTGGFILPLKADVRKREGIVAGGEYDVELEIV